MKWEFRSLNLTNSNMKEYVNGGWLTANVPSTVHLDLLDH